ncbi:lipopolysaccharide heptosyltransferase I [Polynucleobacter sp. QLW-P1DATA-2]|jgi:heptosyltransferase-1|uniref:lipopolysaccharide heptosyltransferase I n=1 Tax=Polynucleobacter sp. MWH-Tro8-2-5-gr TaxID=1855606 RepID=UPI0008F83C0F|nr:lipopolysaccharide heptosyltransferase I [Polynucleobacter sp. MWH-Tro8-2-5-gr]OIN00850.1 lipopolysaccharide heptosyltransferase I [Polynucleobacter sp. QLW-P1DATA-2]OIN02418.1 lipopolysaccharide heptosyltransferase I [Polynucleobacter sp. MWH-Tro8-2-5-gr]
MVNSSESPKILLVKLSSLGDVLHNLPIVWDIRARLPHAHIDWVVEEGYVHLLKPLLSRDGFKGIDRIIPFGLRRWKKSLFSLNSWKQFFAFKDELQEVSYDVIIETQGLLKSALVCALAKKSADVIVAGLANATEFSGYEPISRAFYNQLVQVPFHCHAVDRSRYVTCSALDWELIDRAEKAQFYPITYLESIGAQPVATLEKPYILFFHSTARAAKRWDNINWIFLGKKLSSLGYQIVLPWGSADEKAISEELAMQISGSLVPNAFSIEEAFSVIANSVLVVGVDTGLTHLSAVLNKPTVEIYCDSPRWKTEGYWSEKIRNVGDIQNPPTTEEVTKAALDLLA